MTGAYYGCVPIFRTLNQNFFKIWSPDMAYILGFFAADGYMIKNKRGAHFIGFEITDGELLEKMRELLGSNHKIAVRRQNINWKTSYRLQIGSKTIFNDLLTFGLTPRKSMTITLPCIPDAYFPHFLRGYFDGDGNVVSGFFRSNDRKNLKKILSVRFTSGSKSILESIKEELFRKIGTSGSIHYHSNAWRLSYSSGDSRKIFTFMYQSGNQELIYLERKYKIFLNAGVA